MQQAEAVLVQVPVEHRSFDAHTLARRRRAVIQARAEGRVAAMGQGADLPPLPVP